MVASRLVGLIFNSEIGNRLSTPKNTWVRLTLYSSSDNAVFFSALNDLADGFPRLCVFGDFNLPLFNWDMFIYPDNFLYRTAADFVCNHGLTQLVDTPTRGNNVAQLKSAATT